MYWLWTNARTQQRPQERGRRNINCEYTCCVDLPLLTCVSQRNDNVATVLRKSLQLCACVRVRGDEFHQIQRTWPPRPLAEAWGVSRRGVSSSATSSPASSTRAAAEPTAFRVSILRHFAYSASGEVVLVAFRCLRRFWSSFLLLHTTKTPRVRQYSFCTKVGCNSPYPYTMQ